MHQPTTSHIQPTDRARLSMGPATISAGRRDGIFCSEIPVEIGPQLEGWDFGMPARHFDEMPFPASIEIVQESLIASPMPDEVADCLGEQLRDGLRRDLPDRRSEPSPLAAAPSSHRDPVAWDHSVRNLPQAPGESDRRNRMMAARVETTAYPNHDSTQRRSVQSGLAEPRYARRCHTTGEAEPESAGGCAGA